MFRLRQAFHRALVFSLLCCAIAVACRPMEQPQPTAATTPVAMPTPQPFSTETPLTVSPTPAAAAAVPRTSSASPTPLAPIEVPVLRLGQQWGQAQGVAVVGDVAYAVIGPRLVAVNVADPAAPVMLGQSRVLPGLAAAVVVDDGVAYVAAGPVIVSLDVADPAAITTLSQVDFGAVSQLALAGDTLIAGLNESSMLPPLPPGWQPGGIVTMDVSTPGQPRFLDYAPLPLPVYALATDKGMVYTADPAATDFYALDISNPADLPAPIVIPGAGLIYSLRAAGGVLVAGGGVSDLTAWDVADPLHPQLLWQVQAAADPDFGLGVVEGFVLRGPRALLATAGYDGQTVAIAPLDLPQSLTDGDAPTSGRLAVVDDRAFVAHGDVLIYDLAAAAGAVELGRYAMPVVNDVALLGNTGIVLADNRLLTVRLPDLTVLGEYAGQTHCAPCYAAYQDVALAGDVTYVSAGDDGLRIIDLSDRNAPTLLGSLDATTGFAGLRAGAVAAGELVYLAAAGECADANLLAFDLADPTTPRRAATATAQGCIVALDVAGGRLYAAGNFADRPGGALTVFTESASGPQLAGSLAWPEPISSVRGFGDFALVGTETGLEVVSVADPMQPVAVAALPLPGGAYDIAVLDSLALVTTGGNEGKLFAIDLRAPLAPQPVGGTPLAAAGMRLVVAGSYALVGNAAAGVVLLRVGP